MEIYMKVIAAIDSFKGSMTSMEAGNAVKKGILAAKPDAEVVVNPLADGGEGTVDALIEGLGAKKIPVTVAGPLGEKVSCYYGFLEETKTAVMEMASAAGITLVTKKDPLRASTYGVGEMIADALKRGCKNFMIGIGGSATNDGGIGMLKALGFEFFDEDGNDVGEGAAALAKIEVIQTENKNPLLSGAKFQIACDVKNSLCGKQGATYIFGPQKGVTEEQKSKVDEAMKHYADVTKESLGCDFADCEGAGAAGGLGYAFLSYLAGELIPGVELILQATGLEEKMKNADVVVTGEGRLDAQTVMGKAPVGVAALAKKYNAKVIAFAGSVAPEASVCNQAGIDAFFPIVRGVTTLEEAMKKENAMENIAATAEQVFRLL
jgi:glycerate kinase